MQDSAIKGKNFASLTWYELLFYRSGGDTIARKNEPYSDVDKQLIMNYLVSHKGRIGTRYFWNKMVVEWGGSRETNNDAMAKLAKKMCRAKPDKLQQQFGIGEEDAKFLHSVWK